MLLRIELHCEDVSFAFYSLYIEINVLFLLQVCLCQTFRKVSVIAVHHQFIFPGFDIRNDTLKL